MILQYFKFFINGGILGVIAWVLQKLIYSVLGGNSGFNYLLASALTYPPLVGINFYIQKSLIFNHTGIFGRFIIANISMMLLVSFLSPIMRNAIDSLYGISAGDQFGFVVASLLGSLPSFIITRFWVFRYKI